MAPPPLVAIVDDDSSVRRALSRLLRMAGLQVAVFASAAELLADMPAAACIVLDIHLGGMSGLELLSHFRAEGNNVPVLIITAHDDPHSRELATQTACTTYLRKPLKPPEFLQAVFRAINWEAQITNT